MALPRRSTPAQRKTNGSASNANIFEDVSRKYHESISNQRLPRLMKSTGVLMDPSIVTLLDSSFWLTCGHLLYKFRSSLPMSSGSLNSFKKTMIRIVSEKMCHFRANCRVNSLSSFSVSSEQLYLFFHFFSCFMSVFMTEQLHFYIRRNPPTAVLR